jgi:uncharacterized Zn finger protein (UPF0148 family)
MPEGSVFCEACGAKLLSQNYCTNCGTPLEVDAVFCPNCGTPVEAEESTQHETKLNEQVDKDVSPKQAPPKPVQPVAAEPKTPVQSAAPGVKKTTPPAKSPVAEPAQDRRKLYIAIAVGVLVILGGAFFYMSGSDTPATTAQTSTVTSAVDETPDTKPLDTTAEQPVAKPETAAINAFKRYHSLITSHKLWEAYQLYSESFKGQVAYQGWADGYATTLSSTPQDIKVLQANSTGVSLSYRLQAKDRINGNEVVQYFEGTCNLVKEGNDWKLDEITAKKL